MKTKRKERRTVWGAVPSEAYVRDGEWFFVSKSSGRERALPTPALSDQIIENKSCQTPGV